MLHYGCFGHAIFKELLHLFRINCAFGLGMNIFGFSFVDTFGLTFTYHGAFKLAKQSKHL